MVTCIINHIIVKNTHISQFVESVLNGRLQIMVTQVGIGESGRNVFVGLITNVS